MRFWNPIHDSTQGARGTARGEYLGPRVRLGHCNLSRVAQDTTKSRFRSTMTKSRFRSTMSPIAHNGVGGAAREGQPGAKTRVNGCLWAILGCGNHKQWGVVPMYTEPSELRFKPRSPRYSLITVLALIEPKMGSRVGKRAQTGHEWSTVRWVSYGSEHSIDNSFVIEGGFNPIGREHKVVHHPCCFPSFCTIFGLFWPHVNPRGL